MERKIEKVSKKIMKWSKTLAFPMNQVELENLWRDQVTGFMRSQGLNADPNDQIFQALKVGSLDNLSQTNAESLVPELVKESEELVNKSSVEIDAQHISSASIFLDTLEDLTIVNKATLTSSIDVYFRINHPARSFVKEEKLLKKLEKLMIEMGKLKQPQVFEILHNDISIEKPKEAIEKAFNECEGLTVKETHFKIGEVAEIQFGVIRNFHSEIGKIPFYLIKKSQKKLIKFLEKRGNEFLESYIRQLEINLEVFCQTGIQDLQAGRLRLFDNSKCSQESRIYMGNIVYLTSFGNIEGTRTTLDTILTFLDLPPEAFRQIHTLAKDTNPETFADNWLKSTDSSSRLFTIVSLLLIFSNTYKAILPDYDFTYNDPYTGANREWLRRIIHVSFNNKYEEMFGKSCPKTEWTLVLAAEHAIAKLLPNPHPNNWRFNHNLFNVRDDAQKILEEHYASKHKKVKSSPMKLYHKIKDKHRKKLIDYSFELINPNPSLHITIAISGWLSQGDEMEIAWQLLSEATGQNQTYALRWDSRTRKEVAKKDVPSLLAKAVGSAFIPVLLIPFILSLKNNTFKKSAKQAEKTGIILAHFIADKLFGNACISLIGFSLGTRVIYSCLLELAKMNLKIIHDVTLLGGATPLILENWALCRSVVTGRLINCYSKTDKILSICYTCTTFEKPIGNHEIPIENIENYNVTDFASGHSNYREVLDRILTLIKYNA
ncbi:unnamed protein product [Blepharisma stoltei]|uniref:DUF726 domain-containing protein n=1 Tax=Blepharisma stoltei TaxID=1481888 RepID=A0AAU9JYV6_9CILI|nr:unnamed protein product [Blepharisma stoltei]